MNLKRALIALFALLLIGCGSDDNENRTGINQGQASQIVGQWRISNVSYVQNNQSRSDDCLRQYGNFHFCASVRFNTRPSVSRFLVLEFNANGSGSIVLDGYRVGNFSYSVQGNELHADFGRALTSDFRRHRGSFANRDHFTILHNDGNNLTLRYHRENLDFQFAKTSVRMYENNSMFRQTHNSSFYAPRINFDDMNSFHRTYRTTYRSSSNFDGSDVLFGFLGGVILGSIIF